MNHRLVILLLLAGCGTAKTQYIDTKYDLCRKKCELQFSRYESSELSKCRLKCSQDKYKK